MCAVSSVSFECWSSIYYIICIPFTRTVHCIYQWRSLFINTTCLAIHICLILIAVKYLNLIHSLQEYPAISASLTFACNAFRYKPFEVQLEIVELPFCLNITSTFFNSKHTIVNSPSCRFTLAVLPLRQILAIKQYYSIRRCSSWRL